MGLHIAIDSLLLVMLSVRLQYVSISNFLPFPFIRLLGFILRIFALYVWDIFLCVHALFSLIRALSYSLVVFILRLISLRSIFYPLLRLFIFLILTLLFSFYEFVIFCFSSCLLTRSLEFYLKTSVTSRTNIGTFSSMLSYASLLWRRSHLTILLLLLSISKAMAFSVLF